MIGSLFRIFIFFLSIYTIGSLILVAMPMMAPYLAFVIAFIIVILALVIVS